MTIEVGQKIPSVKLKIATPGGGEEADPAELFKNKKVVLFSLPGAFTPTCSSRHLPEYLAKHDEIKSRGVDIIACLSVNDAWVMHAWAEQQKIGDRILMLADGAGAFTKALGIDADMGALGVRARRGLMTIEDNVVTHVQMEAPGQFSASSAEACLTQL